ncbi:hypothetical protein DFH07DRAFT_991377 [Mycena maculata]|uniref:Uncharacterized protein n=1 Tax=Mycena maculata TaxID=230809 RepID=A0AAD7NRT7_9AGAR|nr:hypothetical protein DFH07DRAFT_991377 [Mycena maculata]
MLKLTTALHEKTVATVAGGAAKDDSTFTRGSALSMLGVNAHGSRIVLAEEGPAVGGAYGDEGVPGRVRAGFRAPDVPGLGGAATRLFELFGPLAHTVLLFGGDEDARFAVASAVSRWPRGAVHGVRVLPAGQSAEGLLGEVVQDREGHAYAAYAANGASEGEMTVVIIRPDGMVGAMGSAAEAVDRYCTLVFG